MKSGDQMERKANIRLKSPPNRGTILGDAWGLIFPGRLMIRSANGSGSGGRLLRDATEHRGVRKVEPWSPAGRTAESSHQPRRASPGEGPRRRDGSEGQPHATDGTAPSLAQAAREWSYVQNPRNPPKAIQPSPSTDLGVGTGRRHAVKQAISSARPIFGGDFRPSKKFARSVEGVDA